MIEIKNRKAYFDYFIEREYECGIVLTGTEIKSIRKGSINLKDSFIKIEENEAFLLMKEQEGVEPLVAGVLHEVLQVGEGPSPTLSNIVSVYYKGMLINGKVFDDNTMQGYPDAFRLNDLIDGWKIALTRMQVGDKWRIYVPSSLGYGAISTPGIPKHSTLIFEIELVGIA